MKLIFKGIIAIVFIVAGLFMFLLGKMVDDGTATMSFWWYAIMVGFFAIALILIMTIAKAKKRN